MKIVPVLCFLFLVCFANIGWMNQDPKINEYIQKGYDSWQAGNSSEALSFYEEALKLQPKNSDTLNATGILYEGFGLPKIAEQRYLSAITLNKKYLPAYLNLGELYASQGDFEKAALCFKNRIKWGNPNDPWTKDARKSLENVLLAQQAAANEMKSRKVMDDSTQVK